jgi:hypothetical protein
MSNKIFYLLRGSPCALYFLISWKKFFPLRNNITERFFIFLLDICGITAIRHFGLLRRYGTCRNRKNNSDGIIGHCILVSQK